MKRYALKVLERHNIKHDRRYVKCRVSGSVCTFICGEGEIKVYLAPDLKKSMVSIGYKHSGDFDASRKMWNESVEEMERKDMLKKFLNKL